MIRYAAFLRGINVGGHKPVRMEALEEAFGRIGFRNVKSVLASGNVLFDAPKGSATALVKKIEEELKKTFGHDIRVLIRTIEMLQRLAAALPFKGVSVTPETRLYVTFLSEKPRAGTGRRYKSPDKNFRIIRASGGEVFSVVVVSPDSRSVDLMGVLEKEYGHNVTTRNWNTINRILAFKRAD
jgi:uncharacterized protein (DUF1697 family)